MSEAVSASLLRHLLPSQPLAPHHAPVTSTRLITTSILRGLYVCLVDVSSLEGRPWRVKGVLPSLYPRPL